MPQCVVCLDKKPIMQSKTIKGMSLVVCSENCEKQAQNGAPLKIQPTA